ncbi:UpxY family transcription antiterminator [Flavobacterium flavipallidum]|uniref:UpxY family transcription antiterminator n=1 Tax=Flavobacterium flavipallidum TaxID=3139140 RepID=A0ABU9HJD5_9FLAO
MNWYVLYTKPKWEKKVAEQLLQKGIECYCPLVTQIKQWSDRKKKVEVPLFNSYVFVRLNETDRNLVFQSSGVVRYLFWLAKPAVVRDEEITTIKNWLEMPDQYEVSVSTLQVGDKVVLESGPFQSHEAVVKEVNRNNNYVLVLESLGCVLKMKLKQT